MEARGFAGVLTDSEVESAVGLMARVAGMTETVEARRDALVRGVAELVGADVWVWAGCRGLATNELQPLYLHDGGYINDAERASVIHHSTQPLFWHAVRKQMPRTGAGTIIYDPARTPPESAEIIKSALASSSLKHLIFSIHPVDDETSSIVGLHRRSARRAYRERDRVLANLILRHADWLHRAGVGVPANSKLADDLSPRLREVLIHLIAGRSRKQIARQMTISEHTVGDYCKTLHRKFDVQSRGELLAKFLRGGGAKE